MDNPVFLLIDLSNQRLDKVLQFQEFELDNIPRTKTGFTGICWYENYLYAAMWDRVCVFEQNGKSLVLQKVFSDPCFSDLHGISADISGGIWVSSTNLDGIYVIKNDQISPIWHSWEDPTLKRDLDFVQADYRRLKKEEIKYYYYHVNSAICVDSDRTLLASYLGPDNHRIREHLGRIGLLSPYRKGGIFLIDLRTKQVKRTISTDGLHDGYFAPDGMFYYTEYFKNRLIQLDLQECISRRIQLSGSMDRKHGYLCRGIISDEDGTFWVGYTLERKSMNGNAIAQLRNYEKSGVWTGKSIDLPGFSGVYALQRTNRWW